MNRARASRGWHEYGVGRWIKHMACLYPQLARGLTGMYSINRTSSGRN